MKSFQILGVAAAVGVCFTAWLIHTPSSKPDPAGESLRSSQKAATQGPEQSPKITRKPRAPEPTATDEGELNLSATIAAIHANTELTPEERDVEISRVLYETARTDPRSILALYVNDPQLFHQGTEGSHILKTALGRWGQLDPFAAAKWIRKNSEQNQYLATDEVAGELIGKVARKDPELAFVLLGDMEHGDPRPFVSEIFTAAATSEERTAAYAAFKDFVFTIADPVLKREIEFKAGDTLRQEIMGDGFDAASSWIDSAELSQAELEGFVDRMDLAPASDDSGKWVDWLANKLPPEKAEKPIKSIVSEWTEADYIAAGVWLADSPESSAKTPSIIAYAETIAPYEPEVAADWAMTLTNKADRRSALWKIYQNWPAADSEGAAAFAATHNFR